MVCRWGWLLPAQRSALPAEVSGFGYSIFNISGIFKITDPFDVITQVAVVGVHDIFRGIRIGDIVDEHTTDPFQADEA